MENLEFKTLMKENKTLHDGMRSGVRSLYDALYSEELIPNDVYNLCKDRASDDFLVDKLIATLRDRITFDCKAFQVLIKILRNTVSMGTLADRLEGRLLELQKEQQRNSEMNARKMKELNDRMEQPQEVKIATFISGIPTSIPQRPTDLGTSALFRDASNTGPAIYGHNHTPLDFLKTGGQASSVGTEIYSIAASSQVNRFLYNKKTPDQLHTRQLIDTATTAEGQSATLEIGLRNKFSLLATSDSKRPQENVPRDDYGAKHEVRSVEIDETKKSVTIDEKVTTIYDRRSGNFVEENGGDYELETGGRDHRYVSENTCENSMLHGNRPIHKRTQSNTSESAEFKTPRSSPEPTSSENKHCDECFKLRRSLSDLYAQIEELEANGKCERSSSHQQITSYREELNFEKQNNYEVQWHYQRRHEEQEAIIVKLKKDVSVMLQQHISNQRQADQSQKLKEMSLELGRAKEEKEREREEKYREREDKERERREKDKEREEKERERQEKEEEREKNVKLCEKNKQLELEIQNLYAQYHRAHSLQCDDENLTNNPPRTSNSDPYPTFTPHKATQGEPIPPSDLQYPPRTSNSDPYPTYTPHEAPARGYYSTKEPTQGEPIPPSDLQYPPRTSNSDPYPTYTPHEAPARGYYSTKEPTQGEPIPPSDMQYLPRTSNSDPYTPHEAPARGYYSTKESTLSQSYPPTHHQLPLQSDASLPPTTFVQRTNTGV